MYTSCISIKDIIDIFQVRENLDPFITGLATLSACEEKLLYYKELFIRRELTNYDTQIEVDHEFHNFIAESCHNNYLMQMISNLYTQNQRIRILSTKLHQRLGESMDEHLKVIEHMLNRDAVRAAQAMKIHIINSRNAAFKLNNSEILQ